MAIDVNPKLNHMSFPSSDVPGTAAFFEKYLGFDIAMKVEGVFYILKRPGFDVVLEWAKPDAPTLLALDANRSSRTCAADVHVAPTWPAAFHVGIELPTLADVRALRERIVADGHETETEVFFQERGSRFFCRAPGGVMFEINTRSDATPEYRNTFN